MNDIQGKLDAKETERAALAEDIAKRTVTEETLTKEHVTLHDETVALKEVIAANAAEHQQQIAALQTSLDAKTAVATELGEKTSVTAQVEAECLRLRTQSAAVEEERIQTREQMFVLMAAEAQFKEDIATLQDIINQGSAEVESSVLEKAKLNSMVESLEIQLKDQQSLATEREADLRRQLNEERDLVLKSDSKARKAESALEPLKNTIVEKEEQTVSLKAELHQAKSQVKKLTTELQSKTVTYEAAIQSTQNALLQKIGEAFEVQKLCYKEIADLTKEKQALTENLMTVRVELASLREQGIYMQEEIREKLGLSTVSSILEVDSLNESIQKMKIENSALTMELKATKTELAVAKDSIMMMPDLDSTAGTTGNGKMAIDDANMKVGDLRAFTRRTEMEKALKDARDNALNESRPWTAADDLAFTREWEANDGVTIDLQEEVAEQLGGEVGRSGRYRAENSNGVENSKLHEQYLSAAALYVIWKARYAIEQGLRKEREMEIESLQLRYAPHTLGTRAQYESLQQAAFTVDFRDLLLGNFVGVTGKDSFNNPVVVLAGAHIPPGIPFERLMQFLVYILDDLVDNPYHIVYINSADSERGPPEPNNDFLERALKLLPKKYFKNLMQLLVLHPTFWFKMHSFPLDDTTHRKMHYIDTIEQLFEQLGRRGTILPGYAYAHEGVMHDSRQLLVAAKQRSWDNTMVEIETGAKQRLLDRDHKALEFLGAEKQRLIREELYADAELVKDEMESLRLEVSALEVELDTTGLEDDIRDIEDELSAAGGAVQATV